MRGSLSITLWAAIHWTSNVWICAGEDNAMSLSSSSITVQNRRRTQDTCPDSFFESIVLMDIVGTAQDLTPQELSVLEEGFEEKYNLLSTLLCSDDTNLLTDIRIEVEPVNPGLTETGSITRRQLQRTDKKTTKRMRFRISGRCRGCGNRRRAFNDVSSLFSARRLQGSQEPDVNLAGSTNTEPEESSQERELGRRGKGKGKGGKGGGGQSQRFRQRGKGEGKGKGRRRPGRRSKGRYGGRRGGRPGRNGGGGGGGGGDGGGGGGDSGGDVDPPPPPCDVCEPPLLAVFADSYNVYVQESKAAGELQNVDYAENLVELEEENCTVLTEFVAITYVDYIGDPGGVTALEINALYDAFVETYNEENALNAGLCDPLFRVVDSVEIELETTRRLQVGQAAKKKRFRFRLKSKGRCRGCRRRAILFDDFTLRRKLSEQEKVDSSHQVESSRNLQLSTDPCYCPDNGLARAPTEEEFTVSYNEAVQVLKVTGEIRNVDGVVGVSNEIPDGTIVNLQPGDSHVELGSTTADVRCGAGFFGGVDVCLLSDLTGSFVDDLVTLRAVSTDIFNSITDVSESARFGVAGFADYQLPYPYRLFSSMSPNLGNWRSTINGLTASGGGDEPEAQYDAIVGAAQGLDIGGGVMEADCGWSDDLTIARVLVVSTDSEFHVPSDGPQYSNDLDSTIQMLEDNNNIRVIGLKAFGANNELDLLAAATGGRTEPLASDGGNIANSILDGLDQLPCTISPVAVGCGELVVTFDPIKEVVPPGGSTTFSETYFVPLSTPVGTTFYCEVQFSSNGIVVGSHLVTVNVV